jgi:cytochrome oxidase Cu insertion factor (SCO1/SenC/PrrC family)
MILKHPLSLLFLLTASVWWAPAQVIAADEATAKVHPKTETSLDKNNRHFFTDLKVMTHEGEELRFYSDILKDKMVVISFFYTNCPTAQPPLVTFFQLQKRLGDRLGTDAMLLTISVDPENDTPEVIKEYARKFNPQKGWLFLTGNEKNMGVINRRLGNTLRLPEGHLRQFLLGNLRTGHWMKLVESAPLVALVWGLHSLESDE